MTKLVGTSLMHGLNGGVKGRRWWLGLAGIAIAALLVVTLFGAPSWAMSREDMAVTLGGAPYPAIASGSISGQVLLEGRPTPPTSSWSIPLQVTLYQGGGIVYTATVVTTDDGGAFSLNGLAIGTYDVRVKGLHTLAKRQDNVSVVISPIVHLEFGPLLEGDANNDNQVGAVDASLLSKGYWKTKGQVEFVAGADFNEDGIIDARDASLLATNYGLVGE